MSNLTTSESVLRKIQKALALSKDKSNPNEAHTALLLAQRLMTKHNVSSSEIEFDSINQSDLKAEESLFKVSSQQWYDIKLARVIADNFKCYWYRYPKYGIAFFGLKEDAAICVEVFKYAKNALKYCVDKFMIDVSGSDSVNIKKNYIHGFIEGLQAAFKEQVEKEELQLALIKHEVVETAYSQIKFKSGGGFTGGNVDSRHDAARAAGYEKGKSLTTNKKLK